MVSSRDAADAHPEPGDRDTCPCPKDPRGPGATPSPILGTGTARRPPAGLAPRIKFTLLNAGQDELK